MRGINGVRLCSQVRQHMMTAPRLALVAQGADVDRRHDDPLARAWRRFRQHPPVEVHDLLPPGHENGRIVPKARPLVRGHDVRHVLDRPAAVDDRPPVHRRRRTPGVHVRRDADQHLRPVGRELTDRLGEQPVVADRAADPADLGVGDGEERLVVPRQVVRAGVDLLRDPRVDLPVPVEDPLRADQAGRVEDHPRPSRVGFQQRSALDVEIVLPRLAPRAGRCARWGSARPACPAIRRPWRRPARRGRTRGRQPAVRARTARCRDRRIDHRKHAIGIRGHLTTIERVGEIGLAGSRRVAQGHFVGSSRSSVACTSAGLNPKGPAALL